jgi:hypothetical protein
MQKPIRYYITKSGEEPTVRSVTVALGSPRFDDRPEEAAAAPVDVVPTARKTVETPDDVKRRVRNAIRRRAPQP